MSSDARRAPAAMFARLARAATACLLVTALGSVPVVVAWPTQKPRCGDMCSRCHCKGHSGNAGLRAPCPCCDPKGAHDGVSSSVPAVLDAAMRTLAPPAPQEPVLIVTESGACAAPSVPHPPPRTPLPA